MNPIHPLAATLSLGLLAAAAAAQSTLIELSGSPGGNEFGHALDWCGDVDGDGVEDLVVGTQTDHGRVEILSGSDGSTLFLRLGNAAVKIGDHVCGPGDLDQDGVPDIFIDSNVGRVYAHSGADGSILWQQSHATGDVNVAGAGDLDGDGRTDLLVAVLFAGSQYTGSLRAYSNLSGAVLWEVSGINTCQALGVAMDTLGDDLDGDGVGELVVGTLGHSACGVGEVYVLSGADGSVLREHVGGPHEALGWAVAGLGDVDGDGLGDYAFGGSSIGHPFQYGFGLAEVRSGADGALLHRWQGDHTSHWLGIAVDGAGDLDQDGHADVLVGAASPAFDDPPGEVWIYSGADGAVLWHARGDDPAEQFGMRAVGGRDVDGDGALDFAVAAPWSNAYGFLHGRVTVYSGAFPAPEVGASVCFGNGGGASCPCGNPGEHGTGCANSSGEGARLDASGSPGVAADDLRFTGLLLVPTTPALLFVGDQAVAGGDGAPFGDGLRCAATAVVRLGVATTGAGGQAFWGPGLAPTGGWQPGDGRVFQAWYRDPVGGPCGSGFNLSNAIAVDFVD